MDIPARGVVPVEQMVGDDEADTVRAAGGLNSIYSNSARWSCNPHRFRITLSGHIGAGRFIEVAGNDIRHQ
jgi:hypothetical protein